MASEIRPVGTVTDIYGRTLEIGQARDAVYLETETGRIVINAGMRDDVMRLIFQADELADQWVEAHP